MPARINKIRHDDESRAKIQVAQIINRLQACIAGEVELSAQQVSAAKILLSKRLPDLQSIDSQVEANIKGNITVVSGVPRADSDANS